MLNEHDKWRYWEKVRKGATEDMCWIWRGRIVNGVPMLDIGSRTVSAARISKEIDTGQELDPAVRVYRTCQARGCTNPKHLYARFKSDEPVTSVAKEAGYASGFADAAAIAKALYEDSKKQDGEDSTEAMCYGTVSDILSGKLKEMQREFAA